jgi:hypothetical protein
VAERATVARITGVRFSPFALISKKEKMKDINKKFWLIGILLALNIIFFDYITISLWQSIRSPLLTGLIIAFCLTIPEMNFSKLTTFFRRKK